MVSAGNNLSLVANTVDLQGQVAAGEALTILAKDAVQIRDSVESPFIAFAGDDLLVQGNQAIDIVVLSHPQSGLFSYGDMTLRSSNSIGGDAHYSSGGDFKVEQLDQQAGSLFSPVDPIIRTQGDVVIGGYRGASLHVIAGGSVILGTAIVTGSEQGSVGIDFVQESVTLSDGTLVEVDGRSQPTLDIRAGVSPDEIGTADIASVTGLDPATDFLFNPQAGIEPPIRADIDIGNVIMAAPNGLVLITNQYAKNTDIAGGNISFIGDELREGGIDGSSG